MNKICVIDIETTGLNVAQDRIVEIAIIKTDGEEFHEEKHTLINPLIPIPAGATEIHEITNEAVADKPSFRQLAKGIRSFIEGCAVAGYNSNAFDLPMLYAEFSRAGIEWNYSAVPLIDVCGIFKAKEPRDLTAAMKFYCDQLLPDAHSALVDARATLKVFAAQISKYDLGEKSLGELALLGNYDKPFYDMGGWFTKDESGGWILAKGKSKGTMDKGFLEWMLKLPGLLSDARKICNSILEK